MMPNIIIFVIKNVLKDNVVRLTLLASIFFILTGGLLINKFAGFLIALSILLGSVFAVSLISHKKEAVNILHKIRKLSDVSSIKVEKVQKSDSDCDICKVKQCTRHTKHETKTNTRPHILIDSNLDDAVESFYSKIISSFVQSWFQLLSNDNDFVQTLKQSLREATSHLIEKISSVDGPTFITQKLCPILYNHVDIVEEMIANGIVMDKLSNHFISTDNPIHPAVGNRQAEKDYLRAVAKCLIPKIFHSENFDSKIFFSLVRELIGCWVLLPIMDVISDPNLLNLIIIHTLSKTDNKKFNKLKENSVQVEFLKNFVDKNTIIIEQDSTILSDNNKLYSFMQYLIKDGVVDVLRFYLDVDNLNKELQDSKTMSDPIKLSTLYKESEKLMSDYEKLVNLDKIEDNENIKTLSEAFENVKNVLEGEKRKAFSKTPEYFKLIYGPRDIDQVDDAKNHGPNTGVSRIRSKIKGAFKITVDGGSYEATEIPTVWDALAEPNLSSGNATIYNSVTQKLRRERGQNLDAFVLTFLQSLEQNTDVGEDVINVNYNNKSKDIPFSANNSLVFGDLFGLTKHSKKFLVSSYISFATIGPSRSFLYFANKILKAPSIFVKCLYALATWSEFAIDIVISQIINKLISMGLYQPRLAVLIKLLEVHIFDETHMDVSNAELLERQKKAKNLLDSIFTGSGRLIDIFQSPPLNKNLMYCAFDAIISELYPELKS